MNNKDKDTHSMGTMQTNEGLSTSESPEINDNINVKVDKDEDLKLPDSAHDLSNEGNKVNTTEASEPESIISSTTTDKLGHTSESNLVKESDHNINDNITCQKNGEFVKSLPNQGDEKSTEECAILQNIEEFADLTKDDDQSKSCSTNSVEELEENKDTAESVKPTTRAQESTNTQVVNDAQESKPENGHEQGFEEGSQKVTQAQATNKELPEWFKVMIGLTHGIHDGKEMDHWEDIRESIDIHGSTLASTVRTNARLIQLIMKRISRIARRDRRLCSCLPNFENFKKTFQHRNTTDLSSLVQSLLKPIADIDDVEVSCEGVRAPCHTGSSTLLHIRCTSCQSLYRVVGILNSPVFKDGIVRIKECLEEEMKDKLDIDANITPESIHDVKNHLREQGILKGTDEFVSCGSHPGKLTEVYCFEHDDICCTTCVQSQHSSCHDVTQVTKDAAEKKKRPGIKRKVKEHNVRIHSKNSDEGNCDIIACCVLPSGEILLADMNNRRLKRLNKALKVIDVCDLPDCPRDVCYLGNHRAAVILFDHSIQFVDISGSPELKEKVDLDHDCFGVACIGDTLYVTDPMSVYTYSIEGKEKGGLYRQLTGHHRFCKIAVSDDKDKLYLAAREGGLVTIDLEGNRLSSLRGRELGIVSDVCVTDDGTLLVCNSRTQTVSRVDSEGKTVLEKVAGRSEDMYMPQSLCYDKYGSRLIVGHLHDDYISVLDIN